MDNILKYQITTNDLSIQQICTEQVLGNFSDTGNMSAMKTDNTFMELSFQLAEAGAHDVPKAHMLPGDPCLWLAQESKWRVMEQCQGWWGTQPGSHLSERTWFTLT